MIALPFHQLILLPCSAGNPSAAAEARYLLCRRSRLAGNRAAASCGAGSALCAPNRITYG